MKGTTCYLRLVKAAFGSIILAIALLCNQAAENPQLLLQERVLLGPDKLEWDHFKNHPSARKELEQTFHIAGAPEDRALLVKQMDVKADGWALFVNDKKAGTLPTIDEPAWVMFALGTNLLKSGENKIRITHAALSGTGSFTDQIEIGALKLFTGKATNLFTSTLEVSVGEKRAGNVPCRITVTDKEGTLVAYHNLTGSKVAARAGVAYSADGKARLGLLPGDYQIYATRGSEYSLASTTTSLRDGETREIKLRLEREVPTPGYVAADTHIHTWTHSRHGDATADERVITIAGEGIELPVVTEHNLHSSYAEPAARIGVNKHFTLVNGNEVTTKRGHFNIFPVDLTAAPPDAKIEDWTELLGQIRKTPQVEFVILNHPTDTHSGFVPFATTNLMPGVGRSPSGLNFGVDALEIINSGAMRSDWMEPYRGWFALLNYGHKILSVAGSDSHDVSRFSLGQGRTYIQVDDRKPEGIDIDAACAALKAGRAFVSLGLFPRITVNGKGSMGDLVSASKQVRVEVEVLGPTWIEASKVELFANGQKVAETTAERPNKSKVRKLNSRWEISLPSNDVHLVAIASGPGPGVRQPYWTIPRPYQPSTTSAESPSLGSTNPVWVDCNRDGQFTPARKWAENILKQSSPDKIVAELNSCDDAVLLQVADLVRDGKSQLPITGLEKIIEKAPLRVRAALGRQ